MKKSVTSFYEILGDEQRLLIGDSISALYAHNILFRNAQKNISNYELFVVRCEIYYNVFQNSKLPANRKAPMQRS